jgi:Alpha-tubulin suppressor and related RCC1 domain-containing proteins
MGESNAGGRGYGTTQNQVISEGNKVTAVASGFDATCAVVDGAAKCWGSNAQGQLGYGGSVYSGGTPNPIQVTGLTSGVTAIDAEGNTACAVTNGGVKCWGAGYATTPVQIAGLEPTNGASAVTAVDIGSDTSGNTHACVLLVNGNIKCWGANGYGQLGNGSLTSTSTPVNGPILNGTPIANTVNISTAEDTTATITLGGLDPEGSSITFSKATDPEHGTVSINASTGIATYTPNANFNGSDHFTYKVRDGVAYSPPATVNIMVTPVSDPTIANNVSARAIKNTRKIITLNGSGDVSEGGSLTYIILSHSNHGNLETIDSNRVAYTPNTDYIGADSFTYKVNNGTEDSAPATVSITIKEENDVPIANAGANFSIYENTPSVALNCLGTDTDSDTLTYAWTTSSNTVLSGANSAAATFTAPQVTANTTLRFTCSVSDEATTVANSVDVTIVDDILDPTPHNWLNDTGVITWGNASSNSQLTLQPDYPGQDADHGRDINADTNSENNGHAGFNFTKIGADGRALEFQTETWDDLGSEAAGTKWSCVKDNNTGLIWEVKNNNFTPDLHDKDWSYTWYQPDNTKNAGNAGSTGGNSCGGLINPCNTSSYVTAVNQLGWCGARDWRLPTSDELFSIVALDRSNPAIDTDYFPKTTTSWSWSSNALSKLTANAWGIHFDAGRVEWAPKSNQYQVTLVRGE